MEERSEPIFDEVKIDLEIDLGEQGGLQRFRNIKEIDNWIREEVQFWNWLQQKPASDFINGFHTISNYFFKYRDIYNQEITRKRNEWTNLQSNITSLLAKDDLSVHETNELDGLRGKSEDMIASIKQQIIQLFKNHVLDRKQHLVRITPEAQFVKELSEAEPIEAIYALDQFLLDQQGRNDKALEINGRVTAYLYERNLNRKLRPDSRAFKGAIKTWEAELKEYRNDYESLKASYQELVASNTKTDATWVERVQDMETEFSDQIEKNDTELNNLKETYEAHMALSAPTKYWKVKRRSHAKQLSEVKNWLIWVSAGSIALMAAAAWFLLPEAGLAGEIPWRNLGLFVLGSTFCLWFVRLLVKLLLSNIHLKADAEERVVMIQTFMAMMAHEESREGLRKEDIALVLAPIFKPSTTGVIKDDGGPVTLSDFISRLGGK